jgi:two-component system response regulator AtoC
MLGGRNILVLEDEVLLRKSLCAYLEEKGAETYPVGSLAQAREIIASTELDFALMDINLPDGNSMDILLDPGFSKNTRVVVMTADGGIRTAIEAIQRGASDYLSKPFAVEELPMVFARIARETAQTRIREFERGNRSEPSDSLFAGERMQVVRKQIDKILAADERLAHALPPVLIEGETGTGKSTIARWIHENGPRSNAPLIEVNCSTLAESLAESELFGHEKGAFTDARNERIGLFEAADGGSLFLDEVSSLPISLQAKVLTAIEDGHIRRVGGTARKTVDVRLITASIHPLVDMVKEGTFREDLYHRLNLLLMRIPPLREYPDDLPGLVERLLGKLKKRYRLKNISIPSQCMANIKAYAWPGNVRELIHELERSLIFSDSDKLTFEHLNPSAATTQFHIPSQGLLNPGFVIPDSGYLFEEDLKKLSQSVIDEALRLENGNVSAAARRLGVARDFIRYRIDS